MRRGFNARARKYSAHIRRPFSYVLQNKCVFVHLVKPAYYFWRILAAIHMHKSGKTPFYMNFGALGAYDGILYFPTYFAENKKSGVI